MSSYTRSRDTCVECKKKTDGLFPLCTTCSRPFCLDHIEIGTGHQCRILNHKMVFLVRRDLNMSSGKTAAQVGHAAVDLVLKASEPYPIMNLSYLPHYQYNKVKLWHDEGGKKVVLGVENEQELLSYKKKAEEAGLIVALVLDYGLTEVPKNSYTVLGIGPDKNERIDIITGQLKPLK